MKSSSISPKNYSIPITLNDVIKHTKQANLTSINPIDEILWLSSSEKQKHVAVTFATKFSRVFSLTQIYHVIYKEHSLNILANEENLNQLENILITLPYNKKIFINKMFTAKSKEELYSNFKFGFIFDVIYEDANIDMFDDDFFQHQENVVRSVSKHSSKFLQLSLDQVKFITLNLDLFIKFKNKNFSDSFDDFISIVSIFNDQELYVINTAIMTNTDNIKLISQYHQRLKHVLSGLSTNELYTTNHALFFAEPKSFNLIIEPIYEDNYMNEFNTKWANILHSLSSNGELLEIIDAALQEGSNYHVGFNDTTDEFDIPMHTNNEFILDNLAVFANAILRIPPNASDYNDRLYETRTAMGKEPKFLFAYLDVWVTLDSAQMRHEINRYSRNEVRRKNSNLLSFSN